MRRLRAIYCRSGGMSAESCGDGAARTGAGAGAGGGDAREAGLRLSPRGEDAGGGCKILGLGLTRATTVGEEESWKREKEKSEEDVLVVESVAWPRLVGRAVSSRVQSLSVGGRSAYLLPRDSPPSQALRRGKKLGLYDMPTRVLHPRTRQRLGLHHDGHDDATERSTLLQAGRRRPLTSIATPPAPLGPGVDSLVRPGSSNSSRPASRVFENFPFDTPGITMHGLLQVRNPLCCACCVASSLSRTRRSRKVETLSRSLACTGQEGNWRERTRRSRGEKMPLHRSG
ncbi:hypothetical protein IWX90DRAFT_69821 [Phyllosticta citrichinensis]|uniref:Uncharacterized protein n=1 Tax=Phyllosticta citrichinensis TaxID=1130410 RepID=A0ABR1XGB8_9PEZI